MAEKIELEINTKGNAKTEISNLSQKIIGLNQGLQLLRIAANAVVKPFSAVIAEGRSFSDKMANVLAVSKLTTKQFKELSDEAKRIGKTTAFSASEAAGAMTELAKAGFSADKILRTTAEAMKLAGATSTDLSTAAGVLAVQYGLFEKQGVSAEKMVNLMVKTANASVQSFGDLSEALKTASPIASTLGISFEEVTAMIGVMAEQGFKGEQAGVAIRAMLSRLIKPSGEAAAAIERLGIDLTKVSKETAFTDILNQFAKAGAKSADVITIFNEIAGTKLVGVLKKGGDAITEFKKKQDAARGATEAQAIKLQTLTGRWQIFISALKGVALTIFGEVESTLKNLTNTGTKFVSRFDAEITKIIATFKSLGTELSRFGAQIMKTISTSDVFNKALTLLRERFEFVKKVVADFITSNAPQLIKIWDNIKSAIDPLINVFGGFLILWMKIGKYSMDIFIPILSGVVSKLIGVAAVISKYLAPSLQFLGKLVKILSKVVEIFFLSLSIVFEWISQIPGKVKKRFTEDLNFIKETFNTVKDAIVKAGEKISKVFLKITRKIKGVVKSLKAFFSPAAKAIQKFLGMNKILPETVKTFIKQNVVASEAAKKLNALNRVQVKTEKSSKKMGGTFSFWLDSIISSLKKAAPAFDKQDTTIKKSTGNLKKMAVAQKKVGTSSKDMETKTISSVAKIYAQISRSQLVFGDHADAAEEAAKKLKSFGDLEVETWEKSRIAALDAARQRKESTQAFAQAKGMQVAGQVVGVTGAMEGYNKTGSPLGAVLGAVTEILLSNQLFQEQIQRLNETITSLVDPIVESIVPLVDGLVNVLKELQPIFDAIGSWLSEIVVQLIPLFKILVPIIRALMPILKPFAPLFKFIGYIIGEHIKVFEPLLSRIAPVLEKLDPAMTKLSNNIEAVTDALEKLIKSLGGGGGGLGDAAGNVASILGFQKGGEITPDRMVQLPGMAGDEGLIKAHVGETVVPKGGTSGQSPNVTFNINAIDPSAQKEEIWQIIEEGYLTGRLGAATA